MKTFTIFGIYCDNMQRHADIVIADTAAEAEACYRRRMKRRGEEMLVAAVVEGDVKAVDEFDNARAMDNYV